MTKKCLTFWLLCCIIYEHCEFLLANRTNGEYMPRFFVDKDSIQNETVFISGADAFHISRSLRMAAGEHITVCDAEEYEYDCILEGFGETVTARVVEKTKLQTEPPYRAILWQALPKGDKLDSIIQKAVECGVYEIRLFESAHCIAKTEPKSEDKKAERRNRIAYEAAKQSGRGIIPKVYGAVRFSEMLENAAKADLPMLCYEGKETELIGKLLEKYKQTDPKAPSVSIVIGPEGGFSVEEAKKAKESGLIPVGLGPRILRTETASGFALGAISCLLELC